MIARMKKMSLVILMFALALPVSAETWKNAALLDVDCSDSAKKLEDPDKHTKGCALKCADSGFGIVVDKKFIKFDAKGSDLAKAAIEKSEKKDHLRATVEGDMKDGVINVSKLTLE